MGTWFEEWGIPATISLFVMLAALGIVVGIINSQHWAESCIHHGGHIKALYKARVCLSDDGRIMEFEAQED